MTDEQILHNIEEAAKSLAREDEIARELGFADKVELRKYLKNHPKVNDIWITARFEFWKEIKQAVYDNVRSGNNAAINLVGEIWQEERGVSSSTLTPAQLKELTGKTHATLATWRLKEGLPYDKRSKTFNLRDVIQFLERYYTKVGRSKGRLPNPKNAFQEMKTKKLEMDLKKEQGNLLEREVVAAGVIARHQRLIQFFHRITDVATQLEGKPLKQIIEVLSKFFDKVIQGQRGDYTELQLNKEIQVKFQEVLDDIKKAEKTS